MKVDMSPKAVKERLQMMNELWLLSVKLMNNKKIRIAKDAEKNTESKVKTENIKPNF